MSVSPTAQVPETETAPAVGVEPLPSPPPPDGLQAIDGPYVEFREPEGYLESARRARLLGFDGKWCIHPNQIEWANAAFTPDPELYERSERLLAAYAEATAAGLGAAVYEGKMIDEATRKLAEKLAAAGRAAHLQPPS